MPLTEDAANIKLPDLIEPNSSVFFAEPAWRNSIESVSCFRVIGLDTVLDHLGVSHGQVYKETAYKDRALASVPASWKEFYPTARSGWKDFKIEQFSNAFHGRPVQLHKAAVALLVACAALDAANLHFEDIFRYVKICPQVFLLDGFDLGFYDKNLRNMTAQREVLTRCRLTSTHLEAIAKGNAVTWLTAENLRNALNHSSIGDVVPQRNSTLIRRRRLKDEPVQFEPGLYNLPPIFPNGAIAQGHALGHN